MSLSLLFVSILATLILTPVTASAVTPVSKGPRIDDLLIKFYPNSQLLYEALEAGEVDLSEWLLEDSQIVDAQADPNIILSKYSDLRMYEFDINHQMWPTNNTEFRRAIAHVVDREWVIRDVLNGYGYPMHTPIPIPALKAYHNPAARVYEYNPDEAKEVLDAAGFTVGADGWRIDPKTGTTLETVTLRVRDDDPHRVSAGEKLASEMEQIGIPVKICHAPMIPPIISLIDYPSDYHLYTGGWSLGTHPTFLFYLYHSSMYAGPKTCCLNYMGFINATYDYWAERLINATSFEEVMEAVLKCQEIIADQVATIPLWCPLEVKAYSTGWLGLISQEGRGVDGWWTFLNCYNQDPSITELKYGLAQTPRSLNVITSCWIYDWDCLDRIYDALLTVNPYDLSHEVGCMAENWEVNIWSNPDNLHFPNSTKLTFNLRNNITWHDATPCDAYDVNFTIWYVKNFPEIAWSYDLVKDVHHTEVPNPQTIIVYINITQIGALHGIGGLPIIPMHIFGPSVPNDLAILDPTGYTPGGLPANQVLIGTGPFTYVSNDPSAGGYLQLTVNHDYFMSALLGGDFNFDGAVDIYDVVRICAAYGSSGTGIPDEKWNSAFDLAPESGLINIYDVVVICANYGKKVQL